MKNTAKTLRELSGLTNQPAKLTDSVVLIIDAQKEAKFLDRARKNNTPIIHIVQRGKAIFNQEGPYYEIIDKVKPINGEIVIEKNFPSSFTNTELDEKLKELGRKDLIITGYMTHMCVNSTTREATEKGYNCTIVSELTTTRDLPDEKGCIIPAITVKKVNLASLAERFAIIVEKEFEIA